MNYIKTFDPCILLGDRLELTLYGMFVEAYLTGRYDKEKEMYKKFISHFLGEIGIHTPDNFIKLIQSIKHNGFNPYSPIYANPDEFTLVQGSHRCAIAIQLGIKKVPYCLRFQDDRVDDSFFQKVFCNQDFNLLQQKQEEYISRCEPIVAFKCRIRRHMRKNLQSFQAPFSSPTRVASLRLYQAFEKLGIHGKRPVQKRVTTYELPRYLNKSMKVLEVGCNVGFLALAIADYVQSVDAFDIDPNYITVAKMVQKFCNVKNCHFFVHSLNEFTPKMQYDFVISAAVHGWSGMSFSEYISTLSQCLKSNDLILFESHEIDVHKDWPSRREMLLSNFDLINSGLIDDADEKMYESELREFLILRKKDGIDYTNLKFSSPVMEELLIDDKTKHSQFFLKQWIFQHRNHKLVQKLYRLYKNIREFI